MIIKNYHLVDKVLMPGDCSLVLAFLSVQPRLELFLKPVAKVGRELALVVQSLLQHRDSALFLLHLVLKTNHLFRQPSRGLSRQLGNSEGEYFLRLSRS